MQSLVIPWYEDKKNLVDLALYMLQMYDSEPEEIIYMWENPQRYNGSYIEMKESQREVSNAND